MVWNTAEEVINNIKSRFVGILDQVPQGKRVKFSNYILNQENGKLNHFGHQVNGWVDHWEEYLKSELPNPTLDQKAGNVLNVLAKVLIDEISTFQKEATKADKVRWNTALLGYINSNKDAKELEVYNNTGYKVKIDEIKRLSDLAQQNTPQRTQQTVKVKGKIAIVGINRKVIGFLEKEMELPTA